MHIHKLAVFSFLLFPVFCRAGYKAVINPYTGQPDLVGISTTTTLITNLTGSKVLVSSGSGAVAESGVSTTTLSYLDATSSIQGQINAKAPTDNPVFTGTPTANAFIIGGATVTAQSVKREITLTVDGANAVIPIGKKDFGVRVPSNMTLTGWELKSYPQTSAGTLKVDVWYSAFGSFPAAANTIVGSSTPTLTTSYISSGTCSGWSTALSEGGSIDLNFQTVTVSTRAVLSLFGTSP
jgi:hypothetical protein